MLAESRNKIADAIDALGKFSAIATDTVNQTKESLVTNLRNIAPVLRELANAGPALTKGLDFLSTYPWAKSHRAQLVPGRLRQHHPRHRSDVEPVGRRLVHRDEVGRRSHRTRNAVGTHDRQKPSPYTAGNPLIAPYRSGAY